METTWKQVLWNQFSAAIDMLNNAIRACPDELWRARLWPETTLQPGFSEFWYIAYHALFWLDYYLSESAEGFAPPAPFDLAEFDPAGRLPERAFTKPELLSYLEYDRNKCRVRIETMTDEFSQQPCRPDWPEMTVAELLLDNLRHVQEHTAQLSLLLGQKSVPAPGWVTRSKRS